MQTVDADGRVVDVFPVVGASVSAAVGATIERVPGVRVGRAVCATDACAVDMLTVEPMRLMWVVLQGRLLCLDGYPDTFGVERHSQRGAGRATGDEASECVCQLHDGTTVYQAHSGVKWGVWRVGLAFGFCVWYSLFMTKNEALDALIRASQDKAGIYCPTCGKVADRWTAKRATLHIAECPALKE